MTDEQWREPPSWPGYLVSSLGRVIGKQKELMTPWLAPDGYMKVCLHRGGRQASRGVHQLVCEAFHGAKPTPEHQVAHGDGDRQNNAKDNLRWATPLENCLDKKLHGTWPSADNHPGAQITQEIADEIRRVHAARRSASGQRCEYGLKKKIAARFGVKVSLVKDVIQGRCWPARAGDPAKVVAELDSDGAAA